MNRLAMTFVLLAATGGCISFERDPMTNGDMPRKTAGGGQPSWRQPDGKLVQDGTADTGQRGYAPTFRTTVLPRRSPVSNPSLSPDPANASVTAAARIPTPQPRQLDPQEDNLSGLAQATYTVAPREQAPSNARTATASYPSNLNTAVPRVLTVKTPPTDLKTQPTKTNAVAVNLGVLRLVNSKRITFHYEVKDAGSSGVAALELWGTHDMKTWKKYNAVSRTKQSYVIEVKDEGLYGFTMLARGSGETGKSKPKDGEVPQVWVAVDLTRPVVQLAGAELNILSREPGLVIRWSAKDKNLGPRPITLAYAERLEGPWTPIAANLENSGRYEWTMAACVPGTVFVRVQAADMMGNVGMAQTPTPLHIPGRTTVTANRVEPSTTEPPRIVTVPPPPTVEVIRPVGAEVKHPAVSILSVDSE